ncbi:hypothetical protein [Nocardioides panacisoli]
MRIVSGAENQATARTDAALARLLVRSACGETAAFMEFFDATCDVVWRLETARHGAGDHAAKAAYARYHAAWLRAGAQRTSGLAPRAWLLSLSAEPVPPCALTEVAGERR